MHRMPRVMIPARGPRVLAGVERALVRAVRDRSRRDSRGVGVHHRHVNGRRHLAQHREDGNQPTMSRSGHARSVSLRPHRGIDRVRIAAVGQLRPLNRSLKRRLRLDVRLFCACPSVVA
jgi:hypothetical protein